MNILSYEHIQEQKTHGDLKFPFNIYPCSIPLDFAAVPLHWHNDMELICVKKGQGEISVDLVSHQASEGDIFLVPPGHLHAIRQAEGHSMEYENIIFQLSLLMSSPTDFCSQQFFAPLLQGRSTLPARISTEHPLHAPLAACLAEIDHYSSQGDALSTLAIKSRLFELFRLLFSWQKQEPNPPFASLRPKSLDLVKTIMKYVENHYGERLTIETMASVSGFSQSHFMKFFKNTMGVSFIEYLNDYRLTMAARLLLASSDTIVAISAECGFENLSYFNRMFRRKYGVTPSEYRKNP